MTAGTPYTRLAAGTYLTRVHRVGHDALWFGPPDGEPPRHRFDAPAGEYRICYLARGPRGAFVETFLRDPALAGEGDRILAAGELVAWRLSYVRVTAELTVARLRGPGLSWRDATAAVSATPRYGETRRLARRIYREEEEPAGLEYRTRHDNDEIAVALFAGRAREALRLDPESGRSCLDVARELEGDYPFVIDESA